MQIILASASARRKDLLQSLGLDFKIIGSGINERLLEKKIKDPKKLAMAIALSKAQAAKERIKKKDFLIIAADTFVVLQSRIIGKPKNRKEAEQMLERLSHKTHQVLTGLVLIDSKGREKRSLVITEVRFRKLNKKEIKDYLDTSVYLDRAGAYGIQDRKCDFVKNYQGSYTNIVGLPLEELKRCLKSFDVKPALTRRGKGGDQLW